MHICYSIEKRKNIITAYFESRMKIESCYKFLENDKTYKKFEDRCEFLVKSVRTMCTLKACVYCQQKINEQIKRNLQKLHFGEYLGSMEFFAKTETCLNWPPNESNFVSFNLFRISYSSRDPHA